ncbi:MAG: HD domain-containing phosphohydrolase [Pseudomonadota bacterium]
MVKTLYTPSRAPMVDAKVTRAELLGSLSHALDLTEGQPVGHCQRSCWIGFHIGLELGLDAGALSDLFYTILLKDLGCSSNAARICELYLTDDLSFKRDFKTVDGSLGAALRFVMAKTGLESGLSERIQALVNVLKNGGQISNELIETRCQRGAEIARKMRFSRPVQEGIRALDEHWDGSGKPDGLLGDEVPVAANIALLAQVLDIFHTEQGREAALSEAQGRAGTWFNPEIVEAALRAQEASAFWDTLSDDRLEQALFSLAPASAADVVDEDYLDEIAAAFSDVVDAKSPFTADHSHRVMLYADMIAAELGLTEPHRRWLRRAALLHDLGKLAVSNQILDKPGRPDEAEWASIKSHPLHSEKILERVAAFKDIAPLAGAHHERLDGKGYPHGLKGEEIGLEVRILTVADVFDALTAERPYRPAMAQEQAFAILRKDTGTAFDGDCVTALHAAMAKFASQAA